MFNHRSVSLALIIVSSTILPAMADAKAPIRHRSAMTTAQVAAAKTRMERDGTASLATPGSVATAPRKSCTNISCLGFATMLGIGY